MSFWQICALTNHLSIIPKSSLAISLSLLPQPQANTDLLLDAIALLKFNFNLHFAG